ncbi:NFX1-type zinc finger-containing protein 1-like [Ptychodera flava]|uniref:NFX1-type zinc finger-containing protein 1-like n=1 Tax=Ptychodera flava TaxID=63121 RepID=UPI003969CD0B
MDDSGRNRGRGRRRPYSRSGYGNRGFGRGGRGGSDRSRSQRADDESFDYGSRADRRANYDLPRRQSNEGHMTRSSREQTTMKYKRLEQLCQKEPSEIVITLNSVGSGFKQLLEEDEIRYDLFVLILECLSKACDCNTSPDSLIGVLMKLHDSPFLLRHLATFLAGMLTEISHEKQLSFPRHIKHTAKVLMKILEKMPSSYVSVIPALSTLEATVNHLRITTNVINDETTKLVDNLKDMRNDLMEAERRKACKKENKYYLDDETPPDDFRTIAVFPDIKDIHVDIEPFVRPNIVDRRYKGVDHYLDVQFRLLREDFMAPLREGIATYLASLKNPLARPKHFQEIRLYYGVHIEYPVCTLTGLVHKIKFDEARLQHVRWQSSKRLIFGSLLCLSKDDFNTLIFATVANRAASDLEQGYLDIRFEDLSQVADISPKDEFIMAETSAYFEAYKHVLKGLQEITEENLPFKPYIINVVTDVDPPKYLRSGRAVYDLRPMIQEPKRRTFDRPLVELTLEDEENQRSDSDADDDEYEYADDPKSNALRSVPILTRYRWPRYSDLNLDESQLRAVQMALTKEFAVIQGPPGTGKTYIGLKIVKTLLSNRNQWSRDRITGQIDKRPIFVVCYTNHALDQFLEGIQEFQQTNLVRVGGRSSSEALKQYNLNFLKSQIRNKRGVPKHIYTGLWSAREEMQRLQEPMEMASELINATRKGVLSEDYLQPFISRHHLESLTGGGLSFDEKYIGTARSIIPQWLGLMGELFVHEEAQNIPQDQQAVTGETEEDEDDMIDIVEEADLEEQNRLIDDDDEYENDIFSGARKQRKDYPSNHTTMANATIALDIERIADQASGTFSKTGAWKMQRKNKGKWKREISKKLQSRDTMTDQKADVIGNVWTLPLEERWRLYRMWIAKYSEHQKTILQRHCEAYETACRQFQEVQNEEYLAILRKAAVIGMTTTGAAKYRTLMQQIQPKIVIIEEAAEVLEAHIITSLTKGCEHLILIGDHQQLRPNPTVYKLAKKFKLDISLFERMVGVGMQCERLSLQHRMRPEIAELMRHFYQDLKNHESVLKYENVKGVSSNIFFVDHKFEEDSVTDTKSKSNLHEVRFLTALCKYFLQQGYAPSQITILTTYTGQLFTFKKYMPKRFYQGVRVSVVDNFQGEENDIILLSLVRSNVEGKIGFLKISNRICVALSRAKKGLFCIGNFTQLAKEENLWSKIVQDARKNDFCGPKLRLTCQNHPEKVIEVATERDFSKAPEGGCTRPCEYRLNCGHQCEMVCHPRDPQHLEYKCRKSCQKIVCERGHKCTKLCHQNCGDSCLVPVEKVIPRCGHRQFLPCYKDERYADCKVKCSKILSCGHKCQQNCGEPCTRVSDCHVEVERSDWPCGHKVKVKCSADPETCPHPCDVTLKCGHKCKGSCGKCRNGRLHIACVSKCDRILACGHACKEPCTRNCPPCTMPCENRCEHSKCPKTCGEVCKPCNEQCRWMCKHHRCTKRCGEFCNRPVCDKPCDKLLKCKHPCIGLCGEPCPNKCRICHQDEVTEILFGTEDEDDARFVQLLDCRHIIEVEALDSWMELEEDTTNAIQFKTCPKCKTTIRKNHRYGNTIKKTIEDIQLVKAKIIGDDKTRQQTTRRLLREIGSDMDISISKELKSNLSKDATMEQLDLIENKINIVREIAKIRQFATANLKRAPHFYQSPVPGLFSKYEMVTSELQGLQNWAMKPRLRFSDQELEDITMETQRLSLLCKLYTLQNGVKQSKVKLADLAKNYLSSAEDILTSRRPLTEAKEGEVLGLLKTVQKLHPEIQHTITDGERKMIVKAMGFSKGHWYKCPNGHIYAIGDCGGATVESKCPECAATIGGLHHQLRDDNRLASEMDGATYSAWSEQANMENYHFDD